MKQLKILVIDDSAAIREYYKECLKDYPFQFEFSYNGIEGLEKFIQQPFQAVFVDINMPKMDGLECVHELRKYEENEHITPIAVVSTQSKKKDKVAAYQAGANAFITKPFTKVDLLQTLTLFGIFLGGE